MKRHRLHTRVFEAWNPNQKCFRIERRAWRKAKVISTPVLLPPPLPPRLFIFHKSLSKRAQYFGIIGNGSVGQEERGEGKKTKKIIIKMSHRESPMSRESERKKKKKKNSEILLKSGGNPLSLPLSVPLLPLHRPVFHTRSSSSEVYLSVILVEQPVHKHPFDRIQRA